MFPEGSDRRTGTCTADRMVRVDGAIDCCPVARCHVHTLSQGSGMESEHGFCVVAATSHRVITIRISVSPSARHSFRQPHQQCNTRGGAGLQRSGAWVVWGQAGN